MIVTLILFVTTSAMGFLPDTKNCGLRMRRECRRPPRLQRKPLISDPGLHRGTCVTHVPWCMSVSLTCGGGENVPGIPSACATRNFAYPTRGPLTNYPALLKVYLTYGCLYLLHMYCKEPLSVSWFIYDEVLWHFIHNNLGIIYFLLWSFKQVHWLHNYSVTILVHTTVANG